MVWSLSSPQKLFIVTGKGGTGKSLCSYALAKSSAKEGLKTLLIETNLQGQLCPLFGSPHKPHEFISVEPDLDYINLDPRQCLGDYFIKFLKQKTIYNLFFNNEKFGSFVHAVPGILEVALLSWVYHVADRNFLGRAYQKVVFDSFSTGHFLKLLMTPGAILNNFLGGLVVNEIRRLQECLIDHKRTKYIVMTLPERVVGEETLDLLSGMLQLLDPKSLLVVVNKILPELDLRSPINTSSEYEYLKAYITGRNKEEAQNIRLFTDYIYSLKKTNAKETQAIDYLFARDLGFLSEPIDDELLETFFMPRARN